MRSCAEAAATDHGPGGPDGSDPSDEVVTLDEAPVRDEAPSSWRHPSIDAVVALGIVLLGLRIGLAPLHDNSFMTHLATGRLIFEDGAVPTADPYSFTALGRDWTVQSWLASVVYAGTEKLFGLAGIRGVVAVCTCGLTLVAWRLSRPAATLVARMVLGVLVVGVGANLWAERPLLFGLLCLGAVLLAAEDQLDARWLVPVMWIWVNVHGSFPLGLVALALLAVGRRLDGSQPGVELRALGWACVGILLGAVNPLGPKLLVFPLRLLENREAFAQVAEWGPPTWQTPAEWFFAVQLALAVVVCLARGRRWRVALPLLVFGAASLMSVRNVAQASFVLLPGMACCLAGLGRIDGTRQPAIARPVVAVLAAVAVVMSVVSLGTQSDTDLSDYPEEAVTTMRAAGLLNTDDRVVSRDFVGNYLEARFGPDEVRVYFDDRVDMYPIAVIRDYTTLIDPEGDYGAVLDRSRASAVLWDRDSDFGRWLERSDQWRAVHRDADWLVVVPVDR